MVIESATSIYRENCISDAMGGHVSIFKGIVESVLKGEVDAESIPALTESLNDAVKSYLRLVNYNLSKEPNAQVSSLANGVTVLLTAETIDQNGLVMYIMNDNVLTSDNDTYKGLVAIPFAYLSLFALAEEGITADRDIITQAMADLEYMDSAKSYAVSILAALAGNEGAIKYNSFDLYNLISPKSEVEDDVDRGDLYEEAYNGFSMVDDKDTVEAVERAMATSDELIAIIKDNAKGIDNTNKLNKMARDKIRKLQYFLDKTRAENPDGYGLAYSKKIGADYSGDAKYRFSRFIKEMMPILDTFKSNARIDAETEKRLLNLTVHDPASYGTKGMQVGAFLSYAAFMIPLIPFAYMSSRNEKRYNASLNRVLPKVIVKSKLVIDNPSTPKEEKIMHELFIMHLMMMGGALATDTTAQDMVREYGVSHTSDLEGVINAKFKELKAVAAATTYKESPHAMSDVDRGDLYEERYKDKGVYANRTYTDVELVEQAFKVSKSVTQMMKNIADGKVSDYKLSAEVKDKLSLFKHLADTTDTVIRKDQVEGAYTDVRSELTTIKAVIRGWWPMIDLLRTRKSLDKSTEAKLMELVDPRTIPGMKVASIAGCVVMFMSGVAPLIPYAMFHRIGAWRRNKSLERVLPKVILANKAMAEKKGVSEHERIMHELMVMHLLTMYGCIAISDNYIDEVKADYGVNTIVDMEKFIDRKFKELTVLTSTSGMFKEAPHAMSAVTVNSQLKGIKKLNKATIEMLKEIAEGNVDKYRMDEKLKTQLKAFYDNAAYLEGDIKGMALLTGLGPKFEKPAKNFVRSLKEFLKGAFPIIEAFRSQASIEKEIEAKIMGMLNPLNTMARNMGTMMTPMVGSVINAMSSKNGGEDIKRHLAGAPMTNPLLTTLGLVNAGAMVIFMVGLTTGERKKRKALLTVCERLEYKFKALMKSKAVDKTEKDLYELMLMHVMLVHKYIDPETYTQRGLLEYAVDLEDEINSKFDEIVRQIGVADKFKEARALVSTRKYRESLVLSRLAKAGRFKENAMGDIEEIGDAATEALIELVNPEYVSDEPDYVEPTEDVMGDTFETVTEVIVEEPTANISTVATAITEDIAEEESTEGDIYQESVKSVKAELGNFVNAKGEADAEAILAVMNALGDGKILFRPSPKLARKFVDLVNFVGAKTLGEQGYTNMSLDVLLSDSANASEFRKEFFKYIAEHIVDTFGGLLSTKADFEYACILGLHTPIRMAEISKGLTADNKAVVRIAKEIVLAIDTFTTTSANYKKLKVDKKEALLDVKASFASTAIATKYKESIDRDYSPAVAAIGTYAIGLDTLLNEKGNSIDFIKSMIKG